jgi:hypothetical protein
MKYIHIILVLLISTLTFGQQSVTFSLVTEKNKIAIGDPIQVSMRINFPAHITPASIEFPEFESNQSLNDTIEILDASIPKTKSSTDNQGNPMMTWQQDFSIGIYAGGNIEIGPFEVVISNGESKDTVYSNVATVSVGTPELQEDKGFVGIKGIEKDPFTLWEKILMWLKAYWLWILIPVVLIIGTIVLIKYLNKKPEIATAQEPKIPVPIQLLSKLEAVEQAAIWKDGKHKEYYSDVTDVIRRLLEYKYEIPALEKTSDEILQSLSLSSINKNDYNQLQNLFALSNMIKFAKSSALAEENIQAMTIAKGLVKKEIRKTK